MSFGDFSIHKLVVEKLCCDEESLIAMKEPHFLDARFEFQLNAMLKPLLGNSRDRGKPNHIRYKTGIGA